MIPLLAALASTSCLGYRTLVGEVVTSDSQLGVACRVRIWTDKIEPLDGEGTAVADLPIVSGTPFQLDVDLSATRHASSGLLWASFECVGYSIKIRAFDRGSGWSSWVSVVDLGRVWVPRLGTPWPPPS